MTSRTVRLSKYSFGMGDRFAQQAGSQLKVCLLAAQSGIELIPVWNKSNREHQIIGSDPGSVQAAAAVAVKQLGWQKPWHVDADHIRLETVDRFLPFSDFYTIDVADSIGKPATSDVVRTFLGKHPELVGDVEIPGVRTGARITREEVERMACKFLIAVQEAAVIYRHIEARRGAGNFIAEVSMDETDAPQTPVELLIILAALADEQVPVQTIAPKFTGRFNKGVDYVGDVAQFEKEFNDDLCVIAHAVKRYGLPDNLKLSVHSGSDKFSVYGVIHRALQRHGAGLHIKTAGTTWLEEIIGLAETGGDGLALAKEIYVEAVLHLDELCGPYASVIDIDRSRLPAAAAVSQWTGAQFAAAVRHDPKCAEFNPHVRQLLHVGYKLAAHKLTRYLNLVRECNNQIAQGVTYNLFDRHVKPIFIGM